MIQHLRSRIIWGIVFIFTFLAASVALVALFLPGGRQYTVRLIRWWARVSLRLAGVRYRAIGVEKIPDEGPVVYIANHQSTLDIPVSIAVLPGRVRMMTKHSLFRIPVFGWLLHAEGFVPVDRKHLRKARLSLKPAARVIKKGVSVFVFAEGTRSRTGEVGAFKTGGYRLAIQAGVPIVPIALIGAENVLGARRWLIKKGEIILVVGEPIETESLEMGDRTRLRDETRQWIAETKKSYESKSSGDS
ncbi:MAG: 1-acyl-sn-glycerol-3-phosphate acyltransferase [Candidatus Latescibacteria bacterium]|nr:1-acyl-sn-glycerol-3-phosphate acyltransferase [Candidatus Latescibacterota bacterium]